MNTLLNTVDTVVRQMGAVSAVVDALAERTKPMLQAGACTVENYSCGSCSTDTTCSSNRSKICTYKLRCGSYVSNEADKKCC